MPSTVINERRRQMLQGAIELLPAVQKLEKLLGLKLAITAETLRPRVDEAVERDRTAHSINELRLVIDNVDWGSLIECADLRKLPFSPEKSDKGFKDALILETYSQLLEELPQQAAQCRAILITDDELLVQAVEARCGSRKNSSIASDLAQLKTFLNPIAAQLQQEDVQKLVQHAGKMLFQTGKQDGLYAKWELYKNLYRRTDIRMGINPSHHLCRAGR